MKFKSGDTILSFMPPFLAIGFSLNVHMPLALGLTVCLCPNPQQEHISAEYCKIRPVHFVAALIDGMDLTNAKRGKSYDAGGKEKLFNPLSA